MKAIAAALALLTTAGAVAPATAQDGERRRPRSEMPRITLYEQPDFQGRSIALYYDAENLAEQGFNDRARSARVEGSWRVCEDKNYRSRCEPFADDVRDFGRYDFAGKISSLQQVGGRPGRPGFEGPAFEPERRPVIGRDGVEGRSVVFFRRPTINGVDVAGFGQPSADAFCREVGLNGAVYFDERERVREALDPQRRPVQNVAALRDVLCRR